jgi:L-cystine transport system permease protein
MTLALLLGTIVCSLLFGVVFHQVRAKKIPVLSQCLRVLMSFTRGVPVIVQLFITYFCLPVLLEPIGIDLSDVDGIYFVVLTYGLFYGSAVAENIRGSLSSVDPGQYQAAATLGMTDFTAFRRIIFPQMFVVAFPNFINIYVGALKNTSLAFSVGVMEMVSTGNMLGMRNMHYMEVYVSLALIYFVIYLIFTKSLGLAAKRISRHAEA